MRPINAILVVALVSSFSSVAGEKQEPQSKPDLRAIAKGFSFPKDPSLPKKFVCNSSYEGLPGQKYKAAAATITADTKILKLVGAERKPAELLKDLKIGVEVEIRFAGPVTVVEAGQVSGTAAEILIVPAEKK
jgi:hypothetical protein